MKNLILTFTISLCAFNLFAWGQKGHDAVAYIAENHLNKSTLDSINNILDNKSIVYWANWLDNASHTPEYAYSKTWHYKNIDADKNYDTMKPNKNGDIVTALDSQIQILKNHNASKDDKALALKMIVHLVGDVHQPMHLGRLSDLGGNKVVVKNFNRDTNLHSTWDSFVIENGHKWSYTEWQDQIDRASDEETAAILSLTTPDQWARQTYEIAKDIYASTPEGTKCSYDYVADWIGVVEQQVLRGGLRLADLLNSIYSPAE